MPEITMDFHNSTAPGHPHFFSLYAEDCLLWCPMKYVWPACGCCAKFLFPPNDHRQSQKHENKVGWMHSCTSSQAALERLRPEAAWKLPPKNQHGQNFSRCYEAGL